MKSITKEKVARLILAVLLVISIIPTTAFARPAATITASAENSEIEPQLLVDTALPEIKVQQSKKSTRSVPERVANLSVDNTDDLSTESGLKLQKNRRTRAAVSNGYYDSVSSYLTATNDSKHIMPIELYPNEVLHVQAELPNPSDVIDDWRIDYDLYLCEIDSSGGLTIVDYSAFTPFDNGVHGTLNEGVGIYNQSSTIRQYAVIIQSFQFGSSTNPFTLHVAINNNTDGYEADENANWSRLFTFPTAGGNLISSADTLADNDWYTFTALSNHRASFTLDSASVAANYKVEVYKQMTQEGFKLEPVIDGSISLTGGVKYFIRVTSLGAANLVTDDYILSIVPQYNTRNITMSGAALDGRYDPALGMFFGDSTPQYETFFGDTFGRIRGNSMFTFSGTINMTGSMPPIITVTVYNPNAATDVERYRSKTVLPANNGTFMVSMSTPYNTWNYRYYDKKYDIGYVYATSGNNMSNVVPFYICSGYQ